MPLGLYPHQIKAINEMSNGRILCGDVGSGKSRAALGYYFKENGGGIGDEDIPMKNPRDLIIITTARKRDTKEWEGDMIPFLLSTDHEFNYYKNNVVVDSWNNIKKYQDVTGAFFIFDEQRLVGNGVWVKSFYKIAKHNDWILLSATPGDTWQDYIPVFVANGFYKNRTDFLRQHAVYSRYAKFPKIDRYLDEQTLTSLKNKVLVHMPYQKSSIQHHENVYVSYDTVAYKNCNKFRWDPFHELPIENVSVLCYVLRKITNSDVSRQNALIDILEEHPRAIIFYNFDYELDILRELFADTAFEVAEWNGHIHQAVPQNKRGNKWVYLVQYTAGCEGWNCVTTDTIIFYSQNYSYKVLKQACGRIDRMNSPFTDLYYYHLKSRSGIDRAISASIAKKKNFNERQAFQMAMKIFAKKTCSIMKEDVYHV